MIVGEIDGEPVDNGHLYIAKKRIDEYFDLDPRYINSENWVYFDLSEDEYKELCDHVDDRIRMVQVYGFHVKTLLRRCRRQ